MTNSFQPDEWAVLKHSLGGRLFQVGEVGPADKFGQYKVTEKPLYKSGYTFDVWSEQLVKVRDKSAGERLVAVLEFIDEQRREKIRQIEDEASKLANRAIIQYEARSYD